MRRRVWATISSSSMSRSLRSNRVLQASPLPPPRAPTRRRGKRAVISEKTTEKTQQTKRAKTSPTASRSKVLTAQPIVNPPATGKGKSKARKTSTKREPPSPASSEPPANWREIYEIVKELRADRSAPVDYYGSEVLPQTDVPKDVYRYQCLIGLMLSSQTKDQMVGSAMRRLQAHGLTVENIHATPEDTVKELIYGVGFHNNKTKYIKNTTKLLHDEHDSMVPDTFKGLVALPGVGPKMALIVLNVAFDKQVGISIDTHLHRMCGQIGWVQKAKNPEDTRRQLEAWLPRECWGEINLIWVGLGQEIQQEKAKLIRKCNACSKPKQALHLIRRFGVDVEKETSKAGLKLLPQNLFAST